MIKAAVGSQNLRSQTSPGSLSNARPSTRYSFAARQQSGQLNCSFLQPNAVQSEVVRVVQQKDDTALQQMATKGSAAPGPQTDRRLHLKRGEVWYFAYGSNMNPAALTGRRGVVPRVSIPCKVPGFQLTFNHLGMPYVEPGFATIEPLPPASQSNDNLMGESKPCVHGVAHAVALEGWQRILQTEGGYYPLEVQCEVYSGAAISALTLASAASVRHSTQRAPVVPSARYLELLIEGASYHGVDAGYLSWLRALESYQPDSFAQALAGRALVAGTMLPAALLALPTLPLAMMKSAQRGGGTQQSTLYGAAAETMYAAAAGTTWLLHDTLWRPFLGDGGRGKPPAPPSATGSSTSLKR